MCRLRRRAATHEIVLERVTLHRPTPNYKTPKLVYLSDLPVLVGGNACAEIEEITPGVVIECADEERQRLLARHAGRIVNA